MQYYFLLYKFKNKNILKTLVSLREFLKIFKHY